MAHVFISYSRRDIWVMRSLRSELQRQHIPVWTDEKLEPGTESWRVTIEQAIDSASCVLPIFSPNAKKSEWVRKELDYADVHHKPFVPILIYGDETHIPFGYTSLQWIDLRPSIDYELALERLGRELRKQLPPLTLDGDKLANLFWLGHDLMWAISSLHYQADQTRILECLQQASHHATECGFEHIPTQLTKLYYRVDNLPPEGLTLDVTKDIAQQVSRLRREVARVISNYQPDANLWAED